MVPAFELLVSYLTLNFRNDICLFILFRKMSFGRVSDLGQFIRESEPEPDVKKSKGCMQFFYFSN